MSMLDGLLAQITQETGGQSHAGLAGSLLQALAGGGTTPGTPGTGGLDLASLLGGGGGGGAGALGALVQAFERNGLGGQAQSWVGTGPNQPIGAEHVRQVLGDGPLQQLAAQHGIDPQAIGGQLATLLPAIVNALTPQGTLPAGGSPLGALGGLFGGGPVDR